MLGGSSASAAEVEPPREYGFGAPGGGSRSGDFFSGFGGGGGIWRLPSEAGRERCCCCSRIVGDICCCCWAGRVEAAEADGESTLGLGGVGSPMEATPRLLPGVESRLLLLRLGGIPEAFLTSGTATGAGTASTLGLGGDLPE